MADVVARISKEAADWLEAHDRGRLEDDDPAYEFGYNLTVADMRELAALTATCIPKEGQAENPGS